MGTVNTKHKDRLFRLIFGRKEDLLELYNAVNDSSYSNPDELEITTMEDIVYMSMKNDVSFLIGDTLNLYEHQSTYNPNMPLRGLFYLSDLLRKYVEVHQLNIYGSYRLKLPLPRYLVFYNGPEDTADRVELRLSDAFRQSGGAEPCLEVQAIMLNINLGHNRELMDRCKKLNDYARFVKEIRANQEGGLPLPNAIDSAVSTCIREGILADILSSHRAEVFNMLMTEYDEQLHKEIERRDYTEIGRLEGIQQGLSEGIAQGLSEGIRSGTADSVLSLLAELGEVPEDLRNRICGQTDTDMLKQWVRLAARIKTIDEFIQGM